MPYLGMSGLGLTARWPGYMAPMAALLVTLSLTLLMSWSGGSAEAISGLVLMILLPAPLVVAVGWAGAFLMGRPPRLVLGAAVAWFVLSWILVPHDYVWSLAGNVVAGLLAGMAFNLRWRLDAALLALSLALSPVLIWTTVQVPVAEQMQILSDEMTQAVERNLPVGADEEQRTQLMANEQAKLDQVVAMAQKVYPFVLMVGVLGQSGIILAMLWLLARALGLTCALAQEPHRWRLPGFSRWKVPFYVVWVLVAGLGLVVTRQSGLAHIGLNLALLAACVLSIQGMAVQFFVTGRLMSPLGRVVYWTVMGVFFGPLVMVSGVVLGLADQWWDIRRLTTGVAANGVGSEIEDDNDESDDDRGE